MDNSSETPRKKPRQDGERSRRTILAAAAKLATLEGLEGLSIGRLANAIGMSKSGLYAHFASKHELQLATIEEAREVFLEEIVAPATPAPPGRPQLGRLTEAYLSYLERGVFPGGCFFAIVASEFSGRSGPIRDRIGEIQREWLALLESIGDVARQAGELPPSTDPTQLAFELNALFVAASMHFLLHDDPGALEKARRGVQARLTSP